MCNDRSRRPVSCNSDTSDGHRYNILSPAAKPLHGLFRSHTPFGQLDILPARERGNCVLTHVTHTLGRYLGLGLGLSLEARTVSSPVPVSGVWELG